MCCYLRAVCLTCGALPQISESPTPSPPSSLCSSVTFTKCLQLTNIPSSFCTPLPNHSPKPLYCLNLLLFPFSYPFNMWWHLLFIITSIAWFLSPLIDYEFHKNTDLVLCSVISPRDNVPENVPATWYVHSKHLCNRCFAVCGMLSCVTKLCPQYYPLL